MHTVGTNAPKSCFLWPRTGLWGSSFPYLLEKSFNCLWSYWLSWIWLSQFIFPCLTPFRILGAPPTHFLWGSLFLLELRQAFTLAGSTFHSLPWGSVQGLGRKGCGDEVGSPPQVLPHREESSCTETSLISSSWVCPVWFYVGKDFLPLMGKKSELEFVYLSPTPQLVQRSHLKSHHWGSDWTVSVNLVWALPSPTHSVLQHLGAIDGGKP